MSQRTATMTKTAVLFALSAIAACTPKGEGGGPAPSATATAATPAKPMSSAAAKPISPLAGTWEGKYDAKKGKVDMPPELKDTIHDGDDGKAATGPGTVTLSIGADGEIKGKLSGALGDESITGSADESTIRGSIVPDPQASPKMAGVLYATLDGGSLKGDIRVSGPDATVVRQAAFELKKR